MTQSHPHPSNSCAGAYDDWLEVNLLPQCNGSCSWCVEARGKRMEREVHWETLAKCIIPRPESNIILLGGEPTLSDDLGALVVRLSLAGKMVWVTTNGSRLSEEYVMLHLRDLCGLNISIHHYDLAENERIVGVAIPDEQLASAIGLLADAAVQVRLNCNCIKGYIDSPESAEAYLEWAARLGILRVRFAELKEEDDMFVSLVDVFPGQGLVEEPFSQGCSHDRVVTLDSGAEMAVNFRQMCGFQTPHRPLPENACQQSKEVLYYDGVFYDGWQRAAPEDQTQEQLLLSVEAGDISAREMLRIVAERQGAGHCRY